MKHLRLFPRGTTLAVLTATMCLGLTRASADSGLENAIKAFDQKNIEGYIQPMVDFFGANMSAGWYHSAAIPEMGLNLSVNIIAMGSLVGDSYKTFTASAPAGFYPSTFQTATVFGGKGGTATAQDTSFSYRGSDGALNTPLFPLATLQLHLGSIYGTEVVIRGFPIPEMSGAPKVTFFGGGIRHSISQYIPAVPLDIAAGVFYNHIAFGDLIDMKSFAIGAQASKSFSVLEVYGGLAYEKSSMDLSYTSTTAGSPNVNISLDGANKFRATAGVGLNLAVFHLYGDVNLGSVTNFSAGLGFGF